MRLLVSVRNVAEAREAAAAGVDFIDLKDPADGALGGLPVASIAVVVQALRALPERSRISATIGDHASDAVDTILQRVAAVAATGVDYVKVGIAPGPGVPALLDALAGCGATVVPVFIADDGVPLSGVKAALAVAGDDARVFPALMLDTQAKLGGSLLQRVPASDLAVFVQAVQATGRLAGLAGALRRHELTSLGLLAPDFAGFRSAVCDGDRAGALVPQRVRSLREACAALGAGAAAH
jgi:(5-formylfuran-3-yl)methyl phosphate synthase